jgi:hypothetical protein
MLSAIASFIGGMFSSSKLQDTAIDGIRKLGGLDEMTDKEKAEFLLSYLSQTKHQSPMRRFIAFAFVAGFMLFTGAWLITTVLFRVGMGFGWSPALMGQLDMLSDDIFAMTKEILLNPVNIIVGFYFVTDMAKRFGSK